MQLMINMQFIYGQKGVRDYCDQIDDKDIQEGKRKYTTINGTLSHSQVDGFSRIVRLG